MVNILGTNVNELVANNKQTLGIVGAGITGLAIGSAVGYATAKRRSKKRKTSRRTAYSRRKVSKSKSSRRKKSPKYARTAGKRKDRSSKRIRMTKNGQPYIILSSGKARFIKKSSARTSRKRKGGRY